MTATTLSSGGSLKVEEPPKIAVLAQECRRGDQEHLRAQQNPSSEREIVFLSGTRIGALKNVQLKPYATGLARRRSARRASGSTSARSADGLHIAPLSIYRFKWFASGTIQTLLTNHAAVRLGRHEGKTSCS